MYYVNFNTQANPKSIPTNLVISILTIPPQQRSLSDHEIVYKFLFDNPDLIEIQRSKSMNARLSCVANLEIMDKRPMDQSEKRQNQQPFTKTNSFNNETKNKDNIQKQEKPMKKIAKIRIAIEIDKQKQKIKEQVQRELNKKKKRSKESQQQYRNYYIVLEKQKYIDIIATNQKYLRENMQILKQYTILKQMKYEQLLHISYYLQKQVFKYKQYVYKEGDSPQYVYFVQKGEFHYIKHLNQEEDASISAHQKQMQKLHKKMNEKSKRYNSMSVSGNPNMIKKSKSIEFEIGILEGGWGQSFGDQQISEIASADKKRQFSVKCMSTQNMVYKIKKQYYRNIIKSTRTQMNWLKNQKMRKFGNKKNILQKILATKNNYQKYIQVIQNNGGVTSSHRTLQHQQETSPQNESLQNSNLPKIYSKNSYQNSNSKYIQQIKSILKSEQSEENNNANETFSLTKPVENGPYRRNLSKSIITESMPNTSMTAQIRKQIPLPTQSEPESLQNSKIKSWSATRPTVELRDMRSKYTKMIDSSSLIRQKQFILAQKLPKEERSDIYPMQLPALKKNQIKQAQAQKPNKIELRGMRSAAHSKDYMQKLLVQALRKAGYNTENKSKKNSSTDEKAEQDYNYSKDNQDNTYDVKINMRLPHNKKKQVNSSINNHQSSGHNLRFSSSNSSMGNIVSGLGYLQSPKSQQTILQQNPFDNYYFNKM